MNLPTDLDDATGVIVVADDAGARAAAVDAVGLVGARLLATVAWRDAVTRVTDQAGPAVLLIEAAGVDGDTVTDTLAALATMVDPARMIVAFGIDQLEEVSAALIGTPATLLPDPSFGDRIAALAMARRTEPLVMSDNRQEAARLAQIDAEIARFTETLAQLTSTPQGKDAATERPPIVGDRRVAFAQPGSDVAITASELRRAIRARRLRDETFGAAGLFEDPAWDMMLDLFAANLEHRQVSVSSLCIAAAVAPTTALRWINKLIELGWFERRPDTFDRRRAYIALTERGVAAMESYIAAVRRAGLSIA